MIELHDDDKMHSMVIESTMSEGWLRRISTKIYLCNQSDVEKERLER